MNQHVTAPSKVCTVCHTDKLLNDFYNNSKGGLKSACKVCDLERKRARYHRDKKKSKEQSIKYTYGLQPDEYNLLLKATPHCPICGSEEPLVVDHDHSTSKVRGLICNHCNLVLGHAKDNIETLKNAIKYLEQ